MGRAQVREVTEYQFQNKIVTLARYLGLKVYHTYDSRRSDPGFPDLVIVGKSGVIFAELKSAKGRVTAHQKMWLESLAGAGAPTYLWRPDDWPEIQQVLTSLSKWRPE